MKFCIDDANVEKIRRIYEYYPIDGVSTNPSILAKAGRDPYEVLKEIREIIGEDGELFVQATSTTAEGMVEEAHKIVEVLGKTTLVKIPCVPEGFKAMKQLKKEGIRFIGTAIYTAMQGFLAAKCGAEYVAPYVNRIDNMGFDGVQVAMDIHDAITENGLDSGLLAALRGAVGLFDPRGQMTSCSEDERAGLCQNTEAGVHFRPRTEIQCCRLFE